MDQQTLKSDLILLLTAAIWGFAFVAQRVGMEHVGPYTFNGVRFALGALVLLPLIARSRLTPRPSGSASAHLNFLVTIGGGALIGLALFAGASFQQVGLQYTTAGNAGFITGLYVVIVPLMGIFIGHRATKATWGAALMAAAGLYLLSVTGDFEIVYGDLLVLIGAFFWAAHVLLIAWLAPRMNPYKLAASQFATCSLLSLTVATIFETIIIADILAAAIPILYGGVFSAGIAYTMQVVAQRTAPPAHAAILLSLEAVFAALGGWLLLNEQLSARGYSGCALMLAGMLFSQLNALKATKHK